MRSSIALLLLLLNLSALARQTPTPAIQAKPEDVKSIDSICKAIYDVISGAPGAKHDWDRMRSLFVENAKMMAVTKSRSGDLRLPTFSVDDYIKLSGAFIEKNGFVEKELAHRIEQFGSLAHVFSTYESHYALNGKSTVARGINSIQLYNDGKRWWVVDIYWQEEEGGLKLPDRYLHNG